MKRSGWHSRWLDPDPMRWAIIGYLGHLLAVAFKADDWLGAFNLGCTMGLVWLMDAVRRARAGEPILFP